MQLSLEIIILVLEKDILVADFWRPLYQVMVSTVQNFFGFYVGHSKLRSIMLICENMDCDVCFSDILRKFWMLCKYSDDNMFRQYMISDFGYSFHVSVDEPFIFTFFFFEKCLLEYMCSKGNMQQDCFPHLILGFQFDLYLML